MAPPQQGPAVTDAALALPPNKTRKGHTRSLADVPQPEQPEISNDLDRERSELMRRNAEMLAKVGISAAIRDVRRAAACEQAINGGSEAGTSGRGAPRPASRPKRAPEQVEPTRRSKRLAVEAAADTGAGEPSGKPATATTTQGAGAMTQEEYFASKGMPLPEGHFRTEGQFTGWVAEDVRERFGLAGSAAEAWEQGGGGKFTRKITKSDIPEHLRGRGWSDAKAFAAAQLHKNPNTYFYRHVAPDKAQANGEFNEEEHRLFVETARKYGVGDKWGLFATYIPNRVGYQCSQYYTQVIIPSGIILDSRFRIDSWGKAIFVGTKGSS